MKILSVGNFTTGWDGSRCDEDHIATALEELGHQVVRMQRGDLYGSWPNDTDFTLIAQWDGYDPGMLAELPRPLVYWAFDYQAPGQAWHEYLVQASNLYLSKPWSDAKYHHWRWLPQDFAPALLQPDFSASKDIDVLFTGSYLPWATDRIEFLRAVDKCFNLTIHTVTPADWQREGFKDVRPPVMDEQLNHLIPRAKINLSIDHTITPGYWSDRNAQTMACGGLVLFRYVPGSELVFRDNIAYAYSADDMLAKIDYYLHHAAQRERLATNGWKFAISNLMVQHRVRDLLTIVEGIL